MNKLHIIQNTLLALFTALLMLGCEPPKLELDSPEVVDEYRQYINNEVSPYFNDNAESGTFEGADGINISYAKIMAENETGALVILHGINEYYGKYAEFIYDLRDLGLSIYIMEHRGHGYSDRILDGSEEDRRKVYVGSFDNYIADVKTFYDTIVSETPHDKKYIFAHSFGGNVATQFIQQNPDAFDAAVLSSPMMEMITTHPTVIREKAGYPITKLAVDSGLGEELALDMQEPEILIEPESVKRFEKEYSTKSWKRWVIGNEFLIANPDLIVGGGGATWGITNNWGKEAYEATFKARSEEEAAKITIPVLVFLSGEDKLVGEKGLMTLKENAVNAPLFEIVDFPDSYHEVYAGRDEPRNKLLTKTKEFLQTH